jgi:nicotinamide riboside kinase
MKFHASILASVAIFILSLEGNAQIAFERWYGGNDDERGHSAIQTANLDYIVVGKTASYGAGSDDVYLIKTNSFGDTIWTRTYGGLDWDWGISIAPTTDFGYIIVGFTTSYGAGSDDVYLIKTDSNGDTTWTRTYGGSSGEWGVSVLQTFDEGYIITGHTWSYGAGSDDVYLIKTDSLGDTIWTRTFGGTGTEWGHEVVQTSDFGYIIAGQTESFGAGMDDVYLIKTDSLGDTIWTRTYGGTEDDWGGSVYQTFDGGYVIAGGTRSYGAGSYDVYLLKTDANGDTIWTRTYGWNDWDQGNSIFQTSDLGYIITGQTYSYGAGSGDIYLIKTDSLGDTLWTRTYGGTDLEWSSSVKQTSDSGYIIAGSTQSFGSGGMDVYLIKTDSLGVDIDEDKKRKARTAKKELVCSPNPFKAVARLQLLGSSMNNNNLQIYDSAGRLVKSVKLTTSTYRLGTELKAGIYFLKLNGTPVGKVVKVR